MTEKIIIDGWNLAWKIPDISHHIPGDLVRARQMLHALLMGYFHGKKTKYEIIYDGKPGIENTLVTDRKVGARFSSDPEKADHLIIKHLRREKRPAQWTIVTSDRELAGRARNLGARSISAEEFIKRLYDRSSAEIKTPEKHDPQLSQNELDYWLDKFTRGENDDQDAE